MPIARLVAPQIPPNGLRFFGAMVRISLEVPT
jgi:hypothetical protein